MNKMMTYAERIKQLREKRGIDTSILLSDWCVSCVDSYLIQSYETRDADGQKIRIGVCGTGCNGILQFGVMVDGDKTRHFLDDEYQENIKPVTMKKKGKIIVDNVPVPLMYWEEVGVET